MQALEGYKAGVNLGGWLSQYPAYDHDHFTSFITSGDIRQIASWGADHVRLPIDYRILEDDEKPLHYRQSGFDYVDRCLDWCQANDLDVVLDLHHAPGFTFGAHEGSTLFTSEVLQHRFVSFWEALTDHFASRTDPGLVFELLNEVVLPTSDPWNRLAHRVFEMIRAIDADRWLMVGGNEWSVPRSLKELELFKDERVFYTFHFYEPFPFTHQKAYWIKALKALDTEVSYPGKFPDMREVLGQGLRYHELLDRYEGSQMDGEFLRKKLQPVFDFQRETGKPVYCGEFGVIDRAPLEARRRWHRDFLGLLRESEIGFAVWSYKLMDFGLVDGEGRVADPALIEIIFSGG